MIEPTAADIRLLVLDVDGVLTDGRILLDERGEEIKAFHVRDGYGLKRIMAAGVEVVLITGRSSGAVAQRAKELGIQEVHQGVEEKGALLDALMRERGLEERHVCCMGDDLPDLPLLDKAGLAVAVADAVMEVRNAAALITKQRGGSGAVREVCEFILGAKGLWPEHGKSPLQK
ncbi:MAG: HAD hydrolase family protein [Desulfobacteraceae bacterium]|jgi:3-deoxy-D-manno-octulosonate 8-phosphate phosphatase (KDO 8-P phosphatase)